jgi:hypothetical protein
MSAGFTAASLSFDFDVDPAKRKIRPDFYGYIPDGPSRTLIFGCMFVNSALLLFIRSFCAALLSLGHQRYFLWYSAGDMGFYLAQKILRGDFHYWLPIDGVSGFTVSLLLRVIVKIIADYTGIVQFRHPGEIGGIYWTLNMFLACVVPFAAVEVYFTVTGESERVIEKGSARRIVSSLSGAWLVVFLLFLKLMKKEYVRTFFCFGTLKDYTVSRFVKGETDEEKVELFYSHRRNWKAIEDDLKEWLEANWERWEEDQPDWFTDEWKSRLPDEVLPAAELRKQKMAGGSQRRRSSLGELMGASVKERRDSATVVPEVVAGVE